MANAAERVFNIPELAESILLQLLQQDILRSQRTSKSFKASIDCSSKIQRKLFLRQSLDTYPSAYYLNPLVLPALRFHGFVGEVYIVMLGTEHQSLVHERVDDRISRSTSGKVHLEPVTNLEVKIDFINTPFNPSGRSYKGMLVGNTPLVFHLSTVPGVAYRKGKVPVRMVDELIEAC